MSTNKTYDYRNLPANREEILSRQKDVENFLTNLPKNPQNQQLQQFSELNARSKRKIAEIIAHHPEYSIELMQKNLESSFFKGLAGLQERSKRQKLNEQNNTPLSMEEIFVNTLYSGKKEANSPEFIKYMISNMAKAAPADAAPLSGERDLYATYIAHNVVEALQNNNDSKKYLADTPEAAHDMVFNIKDGIASHVRQHQIDLDPLFADELSTEIAKNLKKQINPNFLAKDAETQKTLIGNIINDAMKPLDLAALKQDAKIKSQKKNADEPKKDYTILRELAAPVGTWGLIILVTAIAFASGPAAPVVFAIGFPTAILFGGIITRAIMSLIGMVADGVGSLINRYSDEKLKTNDGAEMKITSKTQPDSIFTKRDVEAMERNTDPNASLPKVDTKGQLKRTLQDASPEELKALESTFENIKQVNKGQKEESHLNRLDATKSQGPAQPGVK